MKSCEKGCNFVSRLKKNREGYKIIHGNETTDFIVNYAEEPEVDGHLVIQPRCHIEQIADLCQEQAKELMSWIWKCCKAIQKEYSPKKIYVFSFNEAPDYHLHVHIKPKLQKIPDEVRGPCFVNYQDPSLKKFSNAELKKHNEKQIEGLKEIILS